mmetsp:Transcript_9113/g.20275  ORF Transcript_9113/g.20275 Transcript_9113/m.20275 type:complete len:203 (+) Transcript_9113:132-740(+)|eukprot:CAMPEP_0178418500 /NCGR_PEP_ID=MMETSP0689_2-20121128/25119_1 /TAXON_ID=160604 /ORGANISM="Amphidinium massartii, Strain CS-259" /LENGTH=202 /DNA_ID=CAMNT_0020039893 /DNA_START=127 /DNA_END=735 /DNA_ORIENTATION=-
MVSFALRTVTWVFLLSCLLLQPATAAHLRTPEGPDVMLDILVKPNHPPRMVPEVTERSVCLKTSDGSYMQVSQSDQGEPVHASAHHCGNPGAQWKMVDLNGGELEDGDWVALYHAAYDPLFVSCQEDGKLLWAATQGRDWEKFVVHRRGGGVIEHGNKIVLKSTAMQKYLSATNGGGRSVRCESDAPHGFEEFVLEFVSKAV